MRRRTFLDDLGGVSLCLSPKGALAAGPSLLSYTACIKRRAEAYVEQGLDAR